MAPFSRIRSALPVIFRWSFQQKQQWAHCARYFLRTRSLPAARHGFELIRVRGAIPPSFKDLTVNTGRGMNVWTQPREVHATGNQVPSPPDAGHDRLSLRRVGSVLARRLDQASTVVPRDGSAAQTLSRFAGPDAPSHAPKQQARTRRRGRTGRKGETTEECGERRNPFQGDCLDCEISGGPSGARRSWQNISC